MSHAKACDMININSIREWAELCAVAGEQFQASHCLYLGINYLGFKEKNEIR